MRDLLSSRMSTEGLVCVLGTILVLSHDELSVYSLTLPRFKKSKESKKNYLYDCSFSKEYKGLLSRFLRFFEAEQQI